MRTLVLVGLTMVTALGASAADAQRIGYPGESYPAPGANPVPRSVTIPAPPPAMNPHPMPPRPYPGQTYPGRPNPGQTYPGQMYPGRPNPGQSYPGARWGQNVGGRWYGGSNAPGGWNGYRRPSRGWQMPTYWISPNFYVGDYASYGLYTPQQGYSWQRYYDDAVLVDARGRVSDSRGGIDWDGGYGYADGNDGYASGYGYAEGGAGGAGYGASGQYETRSPVLQGGGVTTYQTGGYASGYSGAYTYPGTTTTVITIQPAETVTTTTTEYVEQTRYVAPRHVYRAPKRVYRAKPKCSCKRVVRYVERPIQGS